VIGLATYLFMANKTALAGLAGKQAGDFKFISINTYQSPISSDFMFESLQPFISYTLKSKSKTITALGFEAVEFWTFLCQSASPEPLYSSLGQFTRDEKSIQFIVQSLFGMMGQHTTTQEVSKVTQKIIFNIL
jgi:hypothetical protein